MHGWGQRSSEGIWLRQIFFLCHLVNLARRCWGLGITGEREERTIPDRDISKGGKVYVGISDEYDFACHLPTPFSRLLFLSLPHLWSPDCSDQQQA